MFGWFTALTPIGQVKTAIAAIAVVAVLGYVAVLKLDNALLISDVKEKAAQIGRLTTDKAVLESSLATQNTAVEDWKKQGENLQILLTQAVQTNAVIAQSSQIRLSQIATAKIPQSCPEAVTWLATQYNITATKWNTRRAK